MGVAVARPGYCVMVVWSYEGRVVSELPIYRMDHTHNGTNKGTS